MALKFDIGASWPVCLWERKVKKKKMKQIDVLTRKVREKRKYGQREACGRGGHDERREEGGPPTRLDKTPLSSAEHISCSMQEFTA